MVKQFVLTSNFLDGYKKRKVHWGYGVVGLVTYKRTYSRELENGKFEEWWQTCQRVVEGTYNAQLTHCKMHGLPFNMQKAQFSAQRMYDLIFNMKFLPPGRGLEHMGAKSLELKQSAILINCSFHSTENIKEDFARPFTYMMDMSALGVGVGFDVRGEGKIVIKKPNGVISFQVPDSREGWVESLKILLEAYAYGRPLPQFDYSMVRPAGMKLHGLGGTSSGPGPLKEMHEAISVILSNLIGKPITITAIVDIFNWIGRCIVSGASRRSAQLALGPFCDEFIELKNPQKYKKELLSHRFASNNSIFAEVGMDYKAIADLIRQNGEPGLFWLGNARHYGRTKDGYGEHDIEVRGTNPCVTGDTLIAVADGRGAVPIEQLAAEGKDVPVYCIDNEGRMTISTGRNPRITGYNQRIVEVEFTNGGKTRVTPNHKFKMRDGTEKRADELANGDAVVQFRKSIEKYNQKSCDKYAKILISTVPLRFEMEHRMIARFHNKERWESSYDGSVTVGRSIGNLVVHHKNHNTLDNSVGNLEIMDAIEHIRYHNSQRDVSGAKNPSFGVPCSEERKEKIRQKAIERCADPFYIERMSDAQKKVITDDSRKRMSKVARDKWQRKYLEIIDTTDLPVVMVGGKLYVKRACEECGTPFEVRWHRREIAYCSSECQSAMRSKHYQRLAQLPLRKGRQLESLKNRQKETLESQLRIYNDLKFQLGRDPMQKEWIFQCRKDGVPYRFRCNETPVYNPYALRSFSDLQSRAELHNCRVKSVRQLDDAEDVYNITVDTYHNYVIVTMNSDSGNMTGVCTTNCGEIALSDGELCNLSEIPLNRLSSLDELSYALKFAYLYNKTVTLIPTHDVYVNAVVGRNRRIGVGVTGVVQAINRWGFRATMVALDKGYRYLRELDKLYSRWLCVPNSIKVSTVKPSGCWSENSLISTSNGIYEFKELIDMKIPGWQNIHEELYADTQFGKRRITKLFNNGMAKTRRILTQDGFELEMTNNHKMEVLRGDSRLFLEASQLRVGDSLIAKLNIYTKEDEPALLKLDVEENKRTYGLRSPENMNPDIAWFLGLFYGNGSVHANGIRIAGNGKHPAVYQWLRSFCQDTFGLNVTIEHKKSSSGVSYQINSVHLIEWLRMNGCLKDFAENIEVPAIIRHASAESIRAFIAGFWRADGGIHNASTWSVCTVSKSFAQKMAVLMRLVGYNVKIKCAGPGEWGSRDRWVISSRDAMYNEEQSRYIARSLKERAVSRNEWLDAIVAIENGECVTMDVEVECVHQYIGNGYISHNSVSLLSGSTPGIHFPHSEYYIRNIRFQDGSPIAEALMKAGYPTEKSVYGDNTVVVSIPVKESDYRCGKNDVSMQDQLLLLEALQWHWADNQVSATITFKEQEAHDIERVLSIFEDRIKSVSFLPLTDHQYEQAPYIAIDEEKYTQIMSNVSSVHSSALTAHEVTDAYCNGEQCAIS